MSEYSEFFLGSGPHVVHLELIEISHARFTQTYRFARNAINGVTVTHENPPGGSFDYSYLPMQIRRLGAPNNLDQNLRITLGDVGQIVAQEIEEVIRTNAMATRPVLKYRAYSSEDLTVPMFGPTVHEIVTPIFTKQGVSFEATSPRLNLSRTGKLYEVKQFPMLKPFFKNSL